MAATFNLGSCFEGRDVIWFLDNEAAVAATVRGASGQPDDELMVQTAHLMWLHLRARIWIDWADTGPTQQMG